MENKMKKEEGKTKKEKFVKRDKSVFEILSTTDFSKKISELQVGGKKLSYLSWSEAWTEVMIIYPDTKYEVVLDKDTGLPYFSSELGVLCRTRVTIEGVTREMWLPVMSNSNKAMKLTAYKNRGKIIEPATMTDINKTIMRCLVKNLAMFGLGIKIYSGEDLPLKESDFLTEEEKVLSEKNKEKEKLDRIIKVAKERVEKYFEDPEDELAIKGFEGAKKWATENNIKEVLGQIRIYEKALKDIEDDDEAVQEKFNSVVGEEVIEPEGKIDFD
jgi:hypothetical protein